MTNTLTRRAFVAAGAAGVAVLPRFARAAPNAVRIGVLTDLAGPYADSGGRGSVVAAQLAVKEFGGTALGLPIEVMSGDTGNKADIAATLARAWFDDGVDAIVDLPVTPIATAVQQIARDKTRTVMVAAATANELTSKTCTPVSSMWIDDNHALVSATAKAAGGNVKRKWFFIVVDYAFGYNLLAEASALIEASGGAVVGKAMFPLGSTDFSSQILSAAAAQADVVGLIAVGNDQVNLIKQTGEFGLGQGGTPTLTAFNVYITDIKSLGLSVAKGLTFGAGYYWDDTASTRAFAERFRATQSAMPTKTQAAVYVATLHFLRSMQQAGTRDALAVNRAMRAAKVDRFGIPAVLRADGRLLYDVGLYRVKAPGDSKGDWDLYQKIGTIAAQDAFNPMQPGCVPG